MRYAKYKVHFASGSNEGTTPDVIIRERGGQCDGMTFVEPWIIGIFSDNADISNLENWSFTEITSEEALNTVLAVNETAYFDENGFIRDTIDTLFTTVVNS